MTLDVSSRYLSQLVTPRYYDGLSPHQLSALSGTSCLQIPTAMSLANDLTSSATQPSIIYSPHCDGSTEHDPVARSGQKLIPAKLLHPWKPVESRGPRLQRSISIADVQAGKQMSSVGSIRSGLRRTPQSIFDLRGHARYQDQALWDQDQAETHSPVKADVQHFSILPRGDVKYEEKRLRRKFQYKSYQDLHILSLYQENGSLLSLNSIPQPQSATIEFSSEGSDITDSSRESSPQPRTPANLSPLDQKSYHENVTTDGERLRRLNARQVHVIESRERVEESDAEIKQATVLIGPGKPRLIQIHRPPRSDHPFMHQHSIDPEPVTPIQNRYGTLPVLNTHTTPASSRTHFSDLSTVKSLKATPASCHTRFSDNSISSSPTPLSAGPLHRPRLSLRTNVNMHVPLLDQQHRKLSTCSSDTMFSLEDGTTTYLSDPFDSPLTTRSAMLSYGTSVLDDSSSSYGQIFRSTTRSITASCKMRSTVHCQREIGDYHIISAISRTNEALDALAGQRFNLDSPILTAFRNTRSSQRKVTDDDLLTTHLRKIFPSTSSSSISILAAWLIVDAHFIELLSSTPLHSTKSSPDRNTYDSPVKAPAPLKPRHAPQSIVSPPLQSKAKFPGRQNSCNTHHCPIISTPMNAANIPYKARSILGIHAQTDPAGCRSQPFRADEHTVKPVSPTHVQQKAQVVHASVQTVGRKLVRDILLEKEAIPGRRAGRLGGSVSSRHGVGTMNSAGAGGEEMDVAVQALWEACRRIASTC